MNGNPIRKIHSLFNNDPFRSKFSDFYKEVNGKKGIKISNLGKLVEEVKVTGHFFGKRGGVINPIELLGTLITRGKDYVDGIQIAQETIQGSSSMRLLTLTNEGIYLARDKSGRTPLVVGMEKARAVGVNNFIKLIF